MVDVAQKLNTSEERVTGVIERRIATKVNWAQFQRIEILGIDEIALKKGHRDYVVLVTTPRMKGAQGVEILAVLADRKKETVVFWGDKQIKKQAVTITKQHQVEEKNNCEINFSNIPG